MDDAHEQQWCDDQRSVVIDYLSREKVKHGEVGERPAWFIAPYVAVWAVESIVRPGWIGWWAISGDLPTDYISCGPERHPRAGLRAIAERWRDAVSAMAEGKGIENLCLGAAENWNELAPLLAARADMLLSFAADDGLWTE